MLELRRNIILLEDGGGMRDGDRFGAVWRLPIAIFA